MKHYFDEIAISTESPIEFIDITDKVKAACARSGIKEGLISIFSRHTTSAVKINERCSRLQDDMLGLLARLAPEGVYRHDTETVDNRQNARSHLMSLLLGASETLPLIGGQPALGAWQSVFFVELDGPRPERRVCVKAIGE